MGPEIPKPTARSPTARRPSSFLWRARHFNPRANLEFVKGALDFLGRPNASGRRRLRANASREARVNGFQFLDGAVEAGALSFK